MTQTKKMKTFKNLCLLFALMLGIAACSKEEQDSTQFTIPNTEGESQLVGSKDSIKVEFTIGADTEELRLAQSLNAEGAPVSPFMEEKDVVIRFAVRKRGTVTYTDAICKKIPGESKATYKGVIRLPDLYSQYDSWPPQYRPPRDLSGHQIAGILLGEADGGTQFVEEVDANTVKTIEQTELLTAENDVVRSKVPYILDWMDFPLTTEGSQTNKLTLHFKPVGNLLRIQLNNQFAEAKTLQSFKISSNAFVTQAKFDFSNWKLRNDITNYHSSVPTTASGNPIETLAADYRLEKTYNLSTPIQVNAKSKSKWYYLWVMPLAYSKYEMDRGNISVRTQVIGQGNDGKDYNMLAICSPLNEGSNKLTMSFKIASTLATAFKGGKLPLWYVADGNVAPNGRSLNYSHQMPDIQSRTKRQNYFGLYNSETVNDISVPNFYLPDTFDWGAVLGVPKVTNTDIQTSLYQTRSYGGNAGSSQIFRMGYREQPNFVPFRLYYRLYNELSVISNVIGNTRPQNIDRQEVSGNEVFVETEEEVRFPGETNPIKTTSIYKSKDYKTVYALRFASCGERDKLTAYRYQFVDAPIGELDYWRYEGWYGYSSIFYNFNRTARLHVTSVFLGSGFTGEIDDIMDTSNPIWRNSTAVTRIFPVGASEPREVTYLHTDVTNSYIHLVYNGEYLLKDGFFHISTYNHWITTQRAKIYEDVVSPVRLMKNEYKTAQ